MMNSHTITFSVSFEGKEEIAFDFSDLEENENVGCHGHMITSSSSTFEVKEPSMKLARRGNGSYLVLSSDSIELKNAEFPTLPLELFLEIASYLDKKDLCTLRQLNREWRRSIDQDQVWRDLLFRTYGIREVAAISNRPCKEQFKDADNVRWSTMARSSKIDLSNNNLTIKDMCKGDEKFRWVTALSENVYAGGLHYQEVVVDVCCESSKNTIKFGFGAVDECTALTHNCPFGYSHGTYTSKDLNSWVYLGDGRIMARNQNTGLCGKPWAKGDRVGVLLDFHNQQLSFFLNGERQMAPVPLVCSRVHVAMSLIGGNQVTLVKNPIMPETSVVVAATA